MKFRFRLQKVLEHRKRLEDEAKRKYFEAVARTQSEKDKLASMYKAIDDSRLRAHQMQATGGGHEVILALQGTDLFIRGQNIRIENQRKVVRDCKQVEEAEQEHLIAAAKERQALEKLREKKLQEFKEGLDRKEAMEVDDLNIIRGLGQKRAEGP
jgi:flagellar protein FliJ